MVTQCQIGGRAHVVGRQGIADAGGGWERRTESGVRVSIFISGRRANGTFFTDAPSRHTEYDSNGKVMTLRDRLHPKKNPGKDGNVISMKRRTLENTPAMLRDFYDAGTGFSWKGVGRDERGGISPDYLYADLVEREGVKLDDYVTYVTYSPHPRVKNKELQEAVISLFAPDFDLATWRNSDDRAVVAAHLPKVLSQIEVEYELVDLMGDDA
ncbi:hypothetical protein [Clavibacter michiganensis]|nr:hypothetical protein [Clavibacter michiganensis]